MVGECHGEHLRARFVRVGRAALRPRYGATRPHAGPRVHAAPIDDSPSRATSHASPGGLANRDRDEDGTSSRPPWITSAGTCDRGTTACSHVAPLRGGGSADGSSGAGCAARRRRSFRDGHPSNLESMRSSILPQHTDASGQVVREGRDGLIASVEPTDFAGDVPCPLEPIDAETIMRRAKPVATATASALRTKPQPRGWRRFSHRTASTWTGTMPKERLQACDCYVHGIVRAGSASTAPGAARAESAEAMLARCSLPCSTRGSDAAWERSSATRPGVRGEQVHDTTRTRGRSSAGLAEPRLLLAVSRSDRHGITR